MTKTSIGLVIGSLFFAGIAGAATLSESCGGQTKVATTAGTSSPGISGTNTCLGFTLPAGMTLQSVSFRINPGFSGNDTTQIDILSWTNAFTGLITASVSNTNTSPVGNNDQGPIITSNTFTSCSAVTTVTFQCTVSGLNITGVVASVSDAVTATWLSGGLLVDGNGSGVEQEFINATFTYNNLNTPEPTTLLLMGGGLIGLVMAGRRKIRG